VIRRLLTYTSLYLY